MSKKKNNSFILDEISNISQSAIEAATKTMLNSNYGTLSQGSKVLMSSTPRQTGKTNSYNHMFQHWLKEQYTEDLRKQRLEKLDIIQLEKVPRFFPGKIQA